MKKTLFSLLFLSFTFVLNAQSNYEKKVLENVAKLNSISNSVEFTKVRYDLSSLNNKANKVTWHLAYYTALTSLKEAEHHFKVGNNGGALDGAVTAIKYLNALNETQKNLQEVNILNGFIHSLMAKINPTGSDLSIAKEFALKAEAVNNNNPRLALLQADLMATELNDTNNAEVVDLYKSALKKFSTFSSKNKLDPKWGKKEVETFLASK